MVDRSKLTDAQRERRRRRTAAASVAAAQRFERLADPDGTMDPAERAARAAELRRAHLSAIARKSWAKLDAEPT